MKIFINKIILLITCVVSFSASANDQVVFKKFSYTGKDALFSSPLPKTHYQNPILAGFYPDPSIVRVGEDYYLANSSFSYFPGVPIHKSRDLVHWQLIGHALTRPEQLNLVNQQVSRGIYAPTLRYHKGIFYLITTHVDGAGNFIVTATDPAGPWSDPILLPEVGGIDPDIFFDNDGKIYISHNDAPDGEPLYNGHRAIWLWEYDPQQKKVIKESRRLLVDGGVDISKKPIWIEGPHLYKINGWYYLLCAEGGTAEDHSQVVFRSRSLQEKFVPYEKNPILTQRDLPLNRPNMVTSAGHADLVQTPSGEWWAVFLATRPYENEFYNTGRETFLLPVTWKDGWPIILEKQTAIPLQVKKPAISESKNIAPITGNFSWVDDFKGPQLNPEWYSLNTPSTSNWYKLDKGLYLTPSSHQLTGLANTSFLARKQQHSTFDAITEIQLPIRKNISAGIVAFQSHKANYFFGVTPQGNHLQIFIEQAKDDQSLVIATAELPLNLKTLTLGIEGDAGKIAFYFFDRNREKFYLLKDADGKYLSTKMAGGFVGVHIGLYARAK